MVHLIAVLHVLALMAGTVALLYFLLALFIGRRAGCHTICWMAPFMIISRKFSVSTGLPRLGLSVRSVECTGCGSCTRICPMRIHTKKLVADERLENPDCILCGTCVDSCPTGVISFSLRR